MIETLLSLEEIQEICDIIKYRCDWYVRATNENCGLYSDVYSPMRKANGVTLAVISGFLPGDMIHGLTVYPVEYGIGQVQPELRSDRVVLHIYRDNNQL